MEVLLTPVVNKLLKRFVKSAEGRSGSSLRVALSGGSVLLYNLELNLEPLLQNFPVTVERAFARQLKLVIPWTALATQPIQVLLDTVEVVICLSDKQISGVSKKQGSAGKNSSGGWMGSFTSLFMQALFNVTVTVSNVIIKYTAPNTVTTMTCGAIKCFTSSDGWRAGLQYPNDWLKKQLDIEDITISLSAQHTSAESLKDDAPLLRTRAVRLAVLAPVFAVLADRTVVGQTTAVTELLLEPVVAAVSSQQVSWLKTFAQMMPTVLAARGNKQETALQQQPSGSIQTPRRGGILGSTVSAVGQAWMYITDEAAAVAAEGPDGLDKAAQHHQPMPKPHLQFNIISEGGSVSCSHTLPDSEEQPASTSTIDTDIGLTGPSDTSAAHMSSNLPTCSPRSNIAYLQELEEAASSLQSTPMQATPHAPQLNPFSANHVGSPHATSGSASELEPEAADKSAGLVTPFAQLHWSSLQCEASVKSAKLGSMRVWLQEVALQCAAPAVTPNEQLQKQQALLGARPSVMQDVFRVQAASGIEHSALQDSQGQPLACHVHWKPGPGAASEQQVSVHVGTVTLVHVPGLITDACTFAGLSTPSAQAPTINSDGASATAAEGNLVSPAPPATSGEAGKAQPRLTVSVSVLGIALGALSSAASAPHALWLICSRVSIHLGQIRARGRPGSLSAGLLALQKPSVLPSAGLRVSAVGMQLGVVPHWHCAVDASTLWPLGMQQISKPFEVQALVQGWPLLQGSAKPHSQQPTLQDRSQQLQSTSVAWPSAPTWQSPDSKNSASAQPASHLLQSKRQRTEHSDITQPSTLPRLVSVASSALELHLTGYHLAVLSSVAEAITAETSRSFRHPLPQQAISPANAKEAGMPAWLGCLSVQSAPAYLLMTLDQELHTILAQVPAGVKLAAVDDARQEDDNVEDGSSVVAPRPIAAPAAVMMCNKVTVTVAVGPQAEAMPAVSITWAEPHAWSSTGLQAHLPACDLHTAVVTLPAQQQLTATGDSSSKLHEISMQAHHQQISHNVDTMPHKSTSDVAVAQAEPMHVSIKAQGSPFAVISTVGVAVAAHLAEAFPKTGPSVTAKVQSVSLDLDPSCIQTLVHFAQCTMLGPAVPVLPCFPPSKQPPDTSLKVEMRLQMLFGQIQTIALDDQLVSERHSDLAFWMNASSLSYSKAAAQAPCAQCNEQGFYQLPTTTKAVSLCLSSFTLATAACPSAAGLPSSPEQLQWVCRLVPSEATDTKSLGDPASSLLNLHYHKIERPHEANQLDVVMTMEVLHAQMSPAFVQATAALGAQCQMALKPGDASGAAMPPPSSVTVKLTSQGVQLWLLSGHHQRAKLHVDDVIVIMRNAPASHAQRLGHMDLQVCSLDLTLAAASLTLYSPGLPPHGLLVLMPASMQLSASACRPPLSLTAALSFSRLPIQLSPAAVFSLNAVANAMRESATLRSRRLGKHGTTELGHPRTERHSMNETHTDHEPHKSSQPAAAAAAAAAATDDLRCGLFSMAPVLASRPGAMQVSMDQEGPGYMPWSSGTEVWVGWCYPYPRPVQVLCVQHGVSLLGQAGLEVCHYQEDIDDYIPVKCSIHPDAITGNLLIFVAEAAAAMEWQLACSSPSGEGSCTAKALLHHLLVNPPALTTDLPPLRPVPLTLALQVKKLEIHLLAEVDNDAVQGSRLQSQGNLSQPVGVVYISSCQAVCHKWPRSYAVAVCAQGALHYMDDVSLTEETLLEPIKTALLLEKGEDSGSNQQQGRQREPQLLASALPLIMSERQLSLPRLEPLIAGLSIQVRCGDGPLLLRISPLSLDTLRRSLQLLSQPCVSQSADSLCETAYQPVLRQSGLPVSVDQQQQQQQQNVQGGILLRNRCPIDLVCSQAGTAECLSLPAGSSLPYCWHTSPKTTATAERLLRIACPLSPDSASSTTPPELSVPFGTSTSLPSSAVPSSPQSPLPEPEDSSMLSQLLVANPTRLQAGEPSPVQPQILQSLKDTGAGFTLKTNDLQTRRTASKELWSDGFDCMARHCCRLRLKLQDGQGCAVAVSVQKVGLQWQVLLQPSFVLLNKTAATVHLHYSGQLMMAKGMRSSTKGLADTAREASPGCRPETSFALEPESKAGSDGNMPFELLPITAQALGRSKLQVWLGSAQGWSMPVSLNRTLPQVVLLRPGGLGEGSPSRPLTSAASATTQGMWCQLTEPDASSGQVTVAIWPLFSIFNALPAPVHWRLLSNPPSSSSSSSINPSLQPDQSTASLGVQDQGVLQPGVEQPLAIALESHQVLAFSLVTLQETSSNAQSDAHRPPVSAASTQSWSEPLLTHSLDRDTAPGFPDSPQHTQRPTVPEAGLWQALDIPTGQGSSLSCLLVAQPGLNQAPLVCLSLVPHAVLYNSLPFEVSLSCPGAEQELQIPAGTSQALDWSHLQYRPKKVAVGVTESHLGVKLNSQFFALDSNHDTQLTLSTAAAPAATAIGLSSSQMLTFHAAVKVQNDPFDVRPGPGGVGGGVTMEVTHISITPGCSVSNLTHCHLSLQLRGQRAQSPGQPKNGPPHPQSAQHQPQIPEQHKPWHLKCAPSQTTPILHAWRHPPLNPSQRPRPTLVPPTSSLIVSVQLDSSSPSPSVTAHSLIPEASQMHSGANLLRAVDVPALTSTEGQAEPSYQQAGIPLMQPFGRTHMLLADPHPEGGQPVLLASKCILNQGRLHLVLFTDPQPPCVLHNAASAAMLVVWCSLRRDKYGELQETESEEVVTVPAGGSVDCSPRSALATGQGAGGDQEDEEAFLEGITTTAGALLPQLAVKVRLHTSPAWSPALLLKPGQHQAGKLLLMVETCCATQHLSFSLQDDAAPVYPVDSVSPGFSPSQLPVQHQHRQYHQPEQQQHQNQEQQQLQLQQQQHPRLQHHQQQGKQQQPVPARVQCQVVIECVVVSVWDDERRRLLSGSAGAGAAPAELCCIYWDSIDLHLTRLPSSGTKGLERCINSSIELTAAGLRCDSFCQDSTYPVVLHSLPTPHPPRPSSMRTPAAFAISLKVCEAARDVAEARSFCNMWVEQLVVQLPTLAVAIDDSLMTLVERCVKHLAGPATSLPAQSQPKGLGGAQGQAGRADARSPGAGPSWTPSATSPMTLLEQARQARQLNDALDSFGASRQKVSGAWPHMASPSRPGGTSLLNMAAASAASFRSPTSNQPSPSTPSQARPHTPSTQYPSPDLYPEPCSDPMGPSGVPALSWAESQLSAELLAQSISAAAPRLLLRNFSIAKIKLLFDIHVADAGPNIPFALDTHSAPLTVAEVGSQRLLYRPSVMLHGLLAHALAEALLSAPGMLGALDLLFNPTGLLHSLGQAWGNLLLGPLAAIEARSPSQFLVGLGAGGASFVRDISAWTLGSIGGFSNASSRVLARALRSQPAAREGGLGVGKGLQSLVGGVTAGVTGVVRAPLQGYNDGSGLVAGVGRGLLGVVGLPLSGALGLVGAVTNGLASTAGLAPAQAVRRPGRTQDGRAEHSSAYLQRLLTQLQTCGSYIAHCHPSTLQCGRQTPDRPESMQQQQQSVQEPVLVLTTSHLLVLALSYQTVCAVPLLGLGLHSLTQQGAWHLSFCQEQTAYPDSMMYSMHLSLSPDDQALWPLLVSQLARDCRGALPR